MEVKINKDAVSHIILYKERRGVQEGYWKNDSYELLPAKKKFWWWFCFFGWNKYIEAFYRNGKYDKDSMISSDYSYYTRES